MKKLLSIFGIFVAVSAIAQTAPVNSKLDAVTVFFKGAQIERAATVTLTAGNNQLLFTGLAERLDPNSIRLSSEQNLPIVSLVHQATNLLGTDEGSKKLKTLTTQLAQLQERLTTDRNLLTTYQREEQLLMANQQVGGANTGLKATDLREAADFFRQRMQEVLSKQAAVKLAIAKQEQDIQKLNGEMTQLNNPTEGRTSEINVTLQSPRPQTVSVRLTYFVENANWAPTYDLRVKDIASPVELLSKASINQFSGENWPNVSLTLSNSNPRRRGVAPELKPWQWGQPNDYSDYHNQTDVQTAINNQVTGRVFSADDNQPIPGVSVQIKGYPLGATTDVNGFYSLTIPPGLVEKNVYLSYNFVGYSPEERRFTGQREINVTLRPANEALNEVVVTGMGAPKPPQHYSKSAARMTVGSPAAMPDAAIELKRLVAENESPTSMNQTLNERFSVPSDGKVYLAELKELRIPAQYEYRTVPKIDSDAFLTAKIPNWEQYNLLPGDVNLFFEGTYLGKSTIAKRSSDTLAISLGRDKNIVVERTRQSSFQRRQFLGSNVTDNFAYEIQVKNLKRQAVTVVVEDQFPISPNRQIEVLDKQAAGATIDPVTEKITWRITLQPGESRKLPFRYAVRYPKGMELGE